MTLLLHASDPNAAQIAAALLRRGELVALRERTAPLGLRWAEEWRWRLTEADAARDRAEDDALRVSPKADAALAEQRALIEEDKGNR